MMAKARFFRLHYVLALGAGGGQLSACGDVAEEVGKTFKVKPTVRSVERRQLESNFEGELSICKTITSTP